MPQLWAEQAGDGGRADLQKSKEEFYSPAGTVYNGPRVR